MTTLDDVFARLRADERAALVGYLTAFDPDRERSLENMVTVCEAGVDVLEVGVPFSDPTADGPTVQGAMVRALKAGATVAGVLELVADLRERVDTPIVLFSYANPLLAFGPARLVGKAAEVGVDALLVVDMPPEVSATLREPARQAGLDWVGLVAPTTGADRLQRIVDVSSGFVYAVTLRGVTGARLDAQRPELAAQLDAIRQRTDLPIVAGFGVRTGEQARTLARRADGVVVGSALIRAAQQGGETLTSLVTELRRGMTGFNQP